MEIILKLIYLCTTIRVINNFKEKSYEEVFNDLVAAFGLAVSANAQTYVGGGFSIFGQDNGNTTVTTYKFIPEIGYNFNKDWAAGVAFGWEGANKGNEKSIEVNPYARYTFLHTKFVNVFVDGGLGYKHTYDAGNDNDLWTVGVRPGVSVNLTKKLSFVSHVGFLGWQQAKNNNLNAKVNKYGLDLDGNNISFSLYYNF